MPDLANFFERIGSPGSIFGLALAGVCLVQYLLHLYYAHRSRKENRVMRRKLELVVDRLACLESDRTIAEAESSTLRRLAEAETVDAALEVLLDHCLPEPEHGFTAYFQLLDSGDPRLRAARGLSKESVAYLTADPVWVSRLTIDPCLQLVQQEARSTAFFNRLSDDDQEQVSRLIVFRVGSARQPAGILITTDLTPPQAALEARIELVERLLATLGSLLHRTEEFEHKRDELRMTRELLELRSLVDVHAGSPVELLEELLQRISAAAGFDRATLHLASGERLDARPLVCTGSGLPRGIADLWRLDEGTLARRGVRASGPLFLGAADLHALRVRSTMCAAFVAPLQQDDILIGVVCLARQSDSPLSETDRELLCRAAEFLRDTILKTVDRAMVEQQARRDALTQLANRHTFDREIRKCVEYAASGGSECTLILLDLDRFKSVNDRYGHIAGDDVLRQVARGVQSCVTHTRTSDNPLVARYGGEELAILLPGVPVAGGQRIAQDVVDTIRNLAIHFEDKLIRPTISAGVASAPRDANTPEELIAAADAALYRAKENGRDRCEVAGIEQPDTLRIAAFSG